MDKIKYKTSKLSKDDIKEMLDLIKTNKKELLKKEILLLNKEDTKNLKEHLNNLLNEDDEDEDDDIKTVKNHLKNQKSNILKSKYDKYKKEYIKKDELNRIFKDNLKNEIIKYQQSNFRGLKLI